MPECPNTAVPAPSLPVCVPPSPAFTSLTVTVKGDNRSADNCQIQPCLFNNCTCRKIFAYEACGTLSIPLAITIQNYQMVSVLGGFSERAYAQNQQHVAWWLSNLGLTSVQTLLKDLSITIDASSCTQTGCTGGYSWAINIFPELEVVRGTLNFQYLSEGSSFALLSGSGGFSKLRATGRTTFTAPYGGGWTNPDLSFLSGLVCPGTQIDGSNSSIGSLTGLDRVVDGNPAMGNQSCFFSFTNSQSVLFNVSAIAPFAGCGGRQRPDNSTFLPCLSVWCGQINTWTALCNYVASGNICL
eukprot:jgi/Botrbrau1/20645/Bobra.113_1s0069.1